ncbi:S8 family peptidase [Tenacibaculum tangerinum]|uniref:S8 family peptidase n=1 Tax=Tenacibaculum tangerinum TaxID=3038772 RepID=A0ABY8L981_9FLAO|nr:S8 family peptidase [Tenacibaculum tangerinum]WGH76565.1 S8 family peptidase [Tenacibaculum tangerinum]
MKKNGSKKYYLVSTKDLILHKKQVDIVCKLDNQFSIIKKKKNVNDFFFKGEIYDINNNWKLSSKSQLLTQQKEKRHKIVVKVIDEMSFFKALKENRIEVEVVHTYKDVLTLKVGSTSIRQIASLYETLYIDTQEKPKTESVPIERIDLSVNNVNKIHNDYTTINGQETMVSVKELLFDVEDIDLRNRIQLQGNEAEETSSHATLMASTIAGAGNSAYNSKGVAYQSHLSSSDFSTLLPDEDAYYTSNGIFIQNHSYGTVIESFYGVEANAYDQSTVDVPELLHVFSSGNLGELTPGEGNYQGVNGYANLTGNFKMAKNVLVVGGINRELEITSRSSKGPTYDGRVKPELVAHAPQGTSDAAAIVSGVASLLQQKYKESTGVVPSAALLKSVLIAGSDDVGVKGIDFSSGYGNVNANQSMNIIEDNSYINDVISNNETREYTISIPSMVKELRIAIVWNDPPANVNDSKALVNDIDLELRKDVNSWLPWVLDATASQDSLEKEAFRGEDHLNNVELITLDNPEQGEYTLRVAANSILTSQQSFSIAYSFQTKDNFTWNYPTTTDRLPSATDVYIRWANGFDLQVSKVEYSVNNGEWIEIENGANISTPFLLWNTPQANGRARLRALVNGTYYTSEEFIISDVITPNVDFNCDETIQFSWNAVPNATAYHIQLLDDAYMYTNSTVSETNIAIPKSTFTTPYIAVTPVFNTEEGVKGQTINYNTQGVNCYYKNFLAFIKDENLVDVRLNLSTLTNVASVFFEKTLNGSTEIIKIVTAPTLEELQIDDTNVEGGENEYSARIVLSDGTEIYTDSIIINFPFDNTLKIYPNPVVASEGMFVYSRGNNLDIEIVDVAGRIIYTNRLQKIRQTIPIPNFKTGVLFVRILKNGKQIAVKKILVQP